LLEENENLQKKIEVRLKKFECLLSYVAGQCRLKKMTSNYRIKP